MQCSTFDNNSRRRGYILILVLGVTAVVCGLGLTFVNANGTALQQAENRYRSTRAQYVSESGIALASHFLLYPPTTVSVGDYWRGGTGFAVDASADYVDVVVQQSAASADLFTVNATGVAMDAGGTRQMAKKLIQAEMLRPENALWQIQQAYLSSTNANIPATVRLNGNIHANGSLNGSGHCYGEASATLTVLWLGGTMPTASRSLAPAVTIPSMTVAAYTNYQIRGKDYSAYSYASNSMGSTEASTLNAINMSATNPGRIILPPTGDFTLLTNARLTGMLVVRGNLRVDGSGIQINAVQDFPALLVTGDVSFQSNNTVVTIAGPVRCLGAFDQGGRRNCSLTVNGCCIGSGNFTGTGTGNSYTFTWTLGGSRFWDFSRSGALKPMTILSWKEQG